MQAPAYLGGALAHVLQPEVSLTRELGAIGRKEEPGTKVLHAQRRAAGLERECHVHPGAPPAVLRHVGEAFLEHAEQRQRALWTDRSLAARPGEAHLQAVAAGGELAVVVQRRDQ